MSTDSKRSPQDVRMLLPAQPAKIIQIQQNQAKNRRSHDSVGTLIKFIAVALLAITQRAGAFQSSAILTRPTSLERKARVAPSSLAPKCSINRMHHLNHVNNAKQSPTQLCVTASVVTAAVAVPTTVMIKWAVGHALIGITGVPFVAKAVNKSTGWYNRIDLPPWTPPNRIFGPTWTTLYSCMGIAFARVMYKMTTAAAVDVTTNKTNLVPWIWGIHMALNLTWVPIFFGNQRFRLGLWNNLAQLGTLLGMIIPMYNVVDKASVYLLLPYAMWLTYATALNWEICRRNPTDWKTGRNAAKHQIDGIAKEQEGHNEDGLKPQVN